MSTFTDGSAWQGLTRKRIEQDLGWVKNIGAPRQLPRIGVAKVNAWLRWNFAACSLIRPGRIVE